MTGPRFARRAYLDHAATTALRPAARDAFLEASAVLGNPTSVHGSGRRARAVLDEALESIAADLGVRRSWLILTSGGTEADNIAIRGAALAAQQADPARRAVAVCASDHVAVLETARSLGPGIETRELPVTGAGAIDLPALEEHLADGAVSVLSAALVNNETGIRQDLDPIAERARARGGIVHTDAVQALGHVPLPEPGTVDLMSLSGHKIGAPVGVGLLVADPGVPLVALSTGGGQQRGVRSGTLDAAQAAAFAAALHEVLAEAETESARLRGLADRLREGIARLDADARLTAPAEVPQAGHIVHVAFPGADQDALLFLLDERGVDASGGSACSAGVHRGSHVLEAMGLPQQGFGVLRFSLGWTSVPEDVDVLLAGLPEALERARAVGALC
ncbi:cysteine desulfurase family protein [Brachybacterium hainanense]|uniref:cysteine desulfurase n=1 Tax=Brachybacterium hainanense TaxID=1541174 RepID=A0ABV6RAK6_9MICO